jgi:hypothetical protein
MTDLRWQRYGDYLKPARVFLPAGTTIFQNPFKHRGSERGKLLFGYFSLEFLLFSFILAKFAVEIDYVRA